MSLLILSIMAQPLHHSDKVGALRNGKGAEYGSSEYEDAWPILRRLQNEEYADKADATGGEGGNESGEEEVDGESEEEEEEEGEDDAPETPPAPEEGNETGGGGGTESGSSSGSGDSEEPEEEEEGGGSEPEEEGGESTGAQQISPQFINSMGNESSSYFGLSLYMVLFIGLLGGLFIISAMINIYLCGLLKGKRGKYDKVSVECLDKSEVEMIDVDQ